MFNESLFRCLNLLEYLKNDAGSLPPEYYSEDDCPLAISPWGFPQKKVAFRMICRL